MSQEQITPKLNSKYVIGILMSQTISVIGASYLKKIHTSGIIKEFWFSVTQVISFFGIQGQFTAEKFVNLHNNLRKIIPMILSGFL